MMSPRDYVVWLQGMLDLIGDRQPTEAEWKMLMDKQRDMFGAVVSVNLLENIERDKAAAERSEYNDRVNRLKNDMLSGKFSGLSINAPLMQAVDPAYMQIANGINKGP